MLYTLFIIHTNDNASQSNYPNLQQASRFTTLATILRPAKRIITTDTFSKVCSSTCWKQRHYKYNTEIVFRKDFTLLFFLFTTDLYFY